MLKGTPEDSKFLVRSLITSQKSVTFIVTTPILKLTGLTFIIRSAVTIG
jgi:hypothetical protein